MAEISLLRRRMIEVMTVRNLSPATQQSYLGAVSKLSRYFGRSPDYPVFRSHQRIPKFGVRMPVCRYGQD